MDSVDSVVVKSLRDADPKVFDEAVAAFGANNVQEFFFAANHTSALRQLARQRPRRPYPKLVAQALSDFMPSFVKVFRNLRNQNYGFHYGLGFEPSESMLGLRLSDHFAPGKRYPDIAARTVAVFSFDLFYNDRGRPSAVLGSMQGGRNEEVEKFKKLTGKSPLDFFTSAFKKAFPARSRLLAQNINHAPFRRERLNDTTLATKLFHDGKIAHDELIDFCIAKSSSNPEPAKVRKLVDEEKAGIESRGSGMHKAAFKKAGFDVRSKTMLWRLRQRR